MAAVGWHMTMISVILIPLILAVGVAHSIHVINRYRLNLENGLDNEAAVIGSKYPASYQALFFHQYHHRHWFAVPACQ
jgi:hypothetical protein